MRERTTAYHFECTIPIPYTVFNHCQPSYRQKTRVSISWRKIWLFIHQTPIEDQSQDEDTQNNISLLQLSNLAKILKLFEWMPLDKLSSWCCQFSKIHRQVKFRQQKRKHQLQKVRLRLSKRTASREKLFRPTRQYWWLHWLCSSSSAQRRPKSLISIEFHLKHLDLSWD